MQVGDLVKTIDGWCSQQFTGMVIEVEAETSHALVLLTNPYKDDSNRHWFPIQKLEALCK